MPKRASKLFVLVGLMGLILAARPISAAAGQQAVTMRTRSLIPPPGGYLYCTVTATSTGPIGVVAEILGEEGGNITAYGTGFRASPEVTESGLYYAEETAGTVTDDAGLCEATVTGARRKDIHVRLTAHGPNNEQVDMVER